jgi:hypothetical protein
MVLDDLVADRRRVVRRHRAKPKRWNTSYPNLLAAVAIGVTLGVYLGLTSDAVPSRAPADQASLTHISAR